MAITLALDTSGYSHFALGREEAILALEEAGSLAMSTVVLGELFTGFRRGNKERANRKRLDEFLDVFAVQILPISVVEAGWYAAVLEKLRAAGKPIPANDVWIAASALAADAMLLTADHHFGFVAGLKVKRLPAVGA